MPLMTKIRDSMTTVFAVFAGVFVVYIVLDWGMDITGRKSARNASASQEVGSINGEVILYPEFAELVRQASENQKAQTGTDPDENDLRTIRDQVWNQMIEQHLYGEEIKHLGITVSDQEIIDWVRGENPPDFLRKQFTDSTGTFNRKGYEAAIQDPRNKAIWVRVEGVLREQREREKLQSVLLASVRVSEGDVLQKFIDQSIMFNADYLLFDPNRLVPENEITVSEDDLRRFYNEHSEEYKVEATRKLKYVSFNEFPSKSDTESVINELADIATRAKAGADFVELAKTYSETPPNDVYFKRSELSLEKENAVFNAKAGDILEPIKEFDGFHLIKVLDSRNGKDDFIHASHILISVENNDSVKALKQAKDILAQAKRGGSFADLAQKYSKDPGSGSKGGDLGWFGKGRMVKEFDQAAFKATVGQIVGPVHTQFGYHIIKILARENREVKISDIHMAVHASSQTRGEISQHAQDFAYLAKQGNFEKEASQSKYAVKETQPFQNNNFIPDFGSNPALDKFAFKNKLGDVSEPISVQNGYAVFMISDVKEAGVRPYDEVKAALETRARREKKMEKLKAMAEELRKSLSPGDSLQTISAKRPDLPMQHLVNFTRSEERRVGKECRSRWSPY